MARITTMMQMKVGVCGIACEVCPRMVKGTCPHGSEGCKPEQNPFCVISSCAHSKGIRLCFQCERFPCEHTSSGPISFGYCRYIAGNE
ncbi:MAG TPA: DUF3795 domain-containing protein [Methanomassiliicoccales archaeon]|nr:DUF3795 domain-containing protein [Methanomassiliicoccales archaeon]